jgi:hypothetical protein
MVELAPMPSPAMRTTNVVNPASCRIPRNAYRRSCAISLVQRAIHVARAVSDFHVILPTFCAQPFVLALLHALPGQSPRDQKT